MRSIILVLVGIVMAISIFVAMKYTGATSNLSIFSGFSSGILLILLIVGIAFVIFKNRKD